MTHYRLPTLLSKSGENDQANLLVDVVSFRRNNKGPIEREVIVVPHEGSAGGGGDEKEAEPVQVWRADAVARQGAVHVRRRRRLFSFPFIDH